MTTTHLVLVLRRTRLREIGWGFVTGLCAIAALAAVLFGI